MYGLTIMMSSGKWTHIDRPTVKKENWMEKWPKKQYQQFSQDNFVFEWTLTKCRSERRYCISLKEIQSLLLNWPSNYLTYKKMPDAKICNIPYLFMEWTYSKRQIIWICMQQFWMQREICQAKIMNQRENFEVHNFHNTTNFSGFC